ncbi:hypothetical protein [Nostoc sp. CMAA1605]|nr:hypothetical protein [Nostoc sp. CMAA1605]
MLRLPKIWRCLGIGDWGLGIGDWGLVLSLSKYWVWGVNYG